MSEITGPNEALLPSPPQPIWMPPAEDTLLPPGPVLRPVPFEDIEAHPTFWSRVGGMFQLVFSHPMELFDRVPITEGFGAPWRFLMLLSIPVFLIMALVFFFLGMGIMLAALDQSGKDGKTLAAVMPIIFGTILVLMPLFSFLGMLIGGMLSHFFLWLWGGLRPGVGMSQTVRAYGYTSAFIQIGGLIPYLNILIQIGGMIVMGMGLARMHKTDAWRGICAVLTPFILLCCCLVPLLLMAIPAFAAFTHR